MALRELIPWKKKDLFAVRDENVLDSLQRELTQVFDRFAHGYGKNELAKLEELQGGAFFSVNISETDKEMIVTAELPGMDEKDLDVSLHGSQLLIRGEKKEEKEEKSEHYYHKESSYGAFHRSVSLPMEVDEDKIEATYKKGVLKIKLPKSVAAQKARKKIEIH